jgi:hypothetical protein
VSPFQSLRDYEEVVYTLQQSFPAIKSSSLVVIQRGKRVAILQGELIFAYGYRLVIRERLFYDDLVMIEDYGYELWYGSEKIAWYDSQPHPDDPTLASTHPHHKHIPPDIKHNRIPAPNISFTHPNLPVLIREVEDLIEKMVRQMGK